MFCKKCGAHISEDAKFCKGCGKVVEGTKGGNYIQGRSLFVFWLVVIAVLGGVAFWYFDVNTSSNTSSDQTARNVPTVISRIFYVQANDTRVHDCASLSCKVLGYYSANEPVTLSYGSLADLPEWVQFNLPDSNGNTITGYLKNTTLGENQVDTKQIEIDALKNRVETLQNNKPEPIIQNSPDYSAIVSEWKNRVAQITCAWAYSDGTVSSASQGSATLANVSGYGLVAVTNAHVESDSSGGAPAGCVIGIYGLGTRTVLFNTNNNPFYHPNSAIDLAFIKINNLSDATDNGAFETYGMPHFKVCSDSEVNQGDEVMILGYPWNGSKSSITSTRGIISGFDGDYYVTDAKIDHGNSGGAAILVKDDCWLGIPSAALVGTIESYGRILGAKYALGN